MAAGNIGQAKSRETVHMILDSAVEHSLALFLKRHGGVATFAKDYGH